MKLYLLSVNAVGEYHLHEKINNHLLSMEYIIIEQGALIQRDMMQSLLRDVPAFSKEDHFFSPASFTPSFGMTDLLFDDFTSVQSHHTSLL